MVEQIEREFTEVEVDERIVTRAHGKVRFAGRTTEVAIGPIFTWRFEGVDGGTKVALVVLEEDLGWFQTLLENVSAVLMANKLHGMLTALKSGAERQASSAA